MKGHVSIQYYSFNEQFNIYQKQQFVEAFFTDPAVYMTLNKTAGDDGKSWIHVGEPLPVVGVEVVPCTITSLDFFDRLYSRTNGVTLGECGQLVGCFDEQIDDFTVTDKLRMMLLSEDNYCGSRELYSEAERSQLLFRLFALFCLGGVWAQYETNVKPYIEAATALYKDLVKVERVTDTSELVIRSVVLSVKATTADGSRGIPDDTKHVQNVLLLVVDPFTRQLAVFYHHWSNQFFA